LARTKIRVSKERSVVTFLLYWKRKRTRGERLTQNKGKNTGGRRFDYRRKRRQAALACVAVKESPGGSTEAQRRTGRKREGTAENGANRHVPKIGGKAGFGEKSQKNILLDSGETEDKRIVPQAKGKK